MTFAQRVQKDIIYQSDPRLPDEVNDYGCRVMSLLAIPQFVTGKTLTLEQIKEIIDKGRFIDGVIITDDMETGWNEHWLINHGFSMLESDRQGRQIGWTEEHLYTTAWEYMIVHWQTGGPDGHFTLYDRAYTELYDPWNAEQAGYKINKQNIDRRLLYRTWEVA